MAMNDLAGHGRMELPKGIQQSRSLPDAQLGALWDSIVLDERLKSQLLSQAVLNFTIRSKVSRTVLPLHGVILLVGEPGTGKTSLARGLAHRTAESFKGARFRLHRNGSGHQRRLRPLRPGSTRPERRSAPDQHPQQRRP